MISLLEMLFMKNNSRKRMLISIVIILAILFLGYVLLFDNELEPINSAEGFVQPKEGSIKKMELYIEPDKEVFTVTDSSIKTELSSESPLSVYPGFHQNKKNDELQLLEERKRERMISECMQNMGFQYTPQYPTVILHDHQYTMEELTEMSNKSGSDEEYYGQMSESERLAYNIALSGMSDPYAEDTESYLNADPNSCTHQAYRALPGIYSVANKLAQEYRDLKVDIASDARITDAVNAWSRCMESKGFEYASPLEIKKSERYLKRSLSSNEQSEGQRKIDAAMVAGKLCDQETETSTIAKKVTHEYEQNFIEKHYELLEASKLK